MSKADLMERALLLMEIYQLEHSFAALEELEDRLTIQLALYHQDDDPDLTIEELQEHLETVRAIRELHDQALQKKGE